MFKIREKVKMCVGFLSYNLGTQFDICQNLPLETSEDALGEKKKFHYLNNNFFVIYI